MPEKEDKTADRWYDVLGALDLPVALSDEWPPAREANRRRWAGVGVERPYFTPDGRPATSDEAWTAQQDPANRRREAFGEPAPKVVVSTTFLAIDHSVVPSSPALIYETMIFGGPIEDWLTRYGTRAAAWQGHDKIVQAVASLMPGVPHYELPSYGGFPTRSPSDGPR